MDGASLYSDVMEINPPMAFLITRAVLVFGDWSGLQDGTALLAALFMAIAVTVFLVDRLARHIPSGNVPRTLLVAASAGALLITSLLDFGQREHMGTALRLLLEQRRKGPIRLAMAACAAACALTRLKSGPYTPHRGRRLWIPWLARLVALGLLLLWLRRRLLL